MPEEVIPATLEELTPPSVKNPTSKIIQEETTLSKIQNVKVPTQKEIKRPRPRYEHIGKENLGGIIKKSIPKQLIPTSRFASILGLIFLAVVILALIQFPIKKLLAGDTDIIIEIGYPFPFLELALQNPNTPPIKPLGLFLDLILYLMISYAIDVVINIIVTTKIIESKEEMKTRAKIFKNIKPTLADKAAKKVFEKKE